MLIPHWWWEHKELIIMNFKFFRLPFATVRVTSRLEIRTRESRNRAHVGDSVETVGKSHRSQQIVGY